MDEEQVLGQNNQIEQLWDKISEMEQQIQSLGQRNYSRDSAFIDSIQSNFWGDGSDGDVEITGTTTLTRDMYYDNLVVKNGGVLITANYVVMAKSRIETEPGGIIKNNGNNGSVGANGAPASPGAGGNGGTTVVVGTLPSIIAGGKGGAGYDGSYHDGEAVSNIDPSWGVSGTNGGDGYGNANSTAGATATSCKKLPVSILSILSPYEFQGENPILGSAPSSGGAGGGSTGDGASGGGGAGSSGGMMILISKRITNNGSIQTVGGNGGNGGVSSAGSGGGGGAGGSGGILIYGYQEIGGAGTFDTSAGNGGSGGTGLSGNGSAGQGGNAGVTYPLQI